MQLASIALSQSLPAALSRHLQTILWLTDSETNDAVACRNRVGHPILSLWCELFADHSIVGLHIETRPGRPRSTGAREIPTFVNAARTRKSSSTTYRTRPSLADDTGQAKSTAHRHLPLFGVQLHRSRCSRASNDPFFIKKVHDIVGPHPNPPDDVLQLSIDRRSQCQMPARGQPTLPMDLSCAEGIAYNYMLRGTTTLFAALDVANRKVLTQGNSNSHHQELMAFLQHTEANVRGHLDVHLIRDEHGTYTQPRVKTQRLRRRRFHPHFTPIQCAWPGQVERWFALIPPQTICCRFFESVADLKCKIDDFEKRLNQHPKPPLRATTAESIVTEIERLCKAINGTQH